MEFDEYRCVIPCYKGGRLYKNGDVFRLPAGEPFESPLFTLSKRAVAVAPKPQAPVKKRKVKHPSEVEG